MATIGLIRTPDAPINVSAVSVASEATVWAPSAGVKFRWLGYALYGNVAGTYTFKDGASGTTILTIQLDGTTTQAVVFGMVGLLSGTKGNALRCVGPAASSLTGFLLGTIESAEVVA